MDLGFAKTIFAEDIGDVSMGIKEWIFCSICGLEFREKTQSALSFSILNDIIRV